MAKHCTVCNQDYEDDLAACPHCAAAKKTHLASRIEDRTTQLAEPHHAEEGEAPRPSDSSIDFGTAGSGEPISGASSIAWSALVEESADEPIKVDSPSDAELLVEGEEAAHAPHEELVGELPPVEPIAPVEPVGVDEEMVELAESPPQERKGVSDSEVDLGGPPAELVEDGSGAVLHEKPQGDSEVFMAELASDAAHIDLVDDSGLRLGQTATETSEPIHEAAAEVVDASIDEGTPAAEVTEEAALDAVEAVEESSAVDLGATPKVVDEELSGEEVGDIAQVPDISGIDLEGLPGLGDSSSGLHPSSESSVDLGSHAQNLTSPSGKNEAMAGSGIDVDPVSDMVLHSASQFVSDEPNAEKPAAVGDEAPVSEEEVNDLLAGLEETPAVGEAEGMTAGEAAEIAEGEEAIAAAEAEEAAEAAAVEESAEAAADEEEETPKKPSKPRSRVPALVGGTFLGILIGAGGLIGARFGGVDVPAMIGAGEKEKAPVRSSAPPAPTVTFKDRAAHVERGDWEQASQAGIDQIQETNAEELATRGYNRLGAYLSKVGNKINPNDPALQSAVQDLQKAAEMNSADALYGLAWIQELAGKLPEARAEYMKGVQKFANDPAKKRRFETAIYRVDSRIEAQAAGAFLFPLPENASERAAVLTLLLIGLQQPPQPPGQAGQPPQPPGQQPAAPPAEESKEAGFEFWQANKLAREGKYGDAIRLLDQARALHDERRFKRLRKAQNPLSDPAEDIFLRCCDELKVYWQLENQLRDKGYLTEKKSPQQALQALMNDAVGNSAILKTVNDKLVKAKLVAEGDDLSKGVDRIISEKKKAEDAVADLTAKLNQATEDNKKLTGDLATAKKNLMDQETALTAAKEENTKLKEANGALNGTLDKIRAELTEAKLLDPKNKANVAEAVKKAVDVAKIKDPQGMIRQQRDEIVRMAAALSERWKPEEMLPLWLLLLDENRNRGDLARLAGKDVDRVTADARATTAQKGEAAIVLGLALRNTEQFPEAKKMLEAGRGSVDKGEWLAHADAALREVSNPTAYFARQAQTLYDRGQMDAAIAVLNRAMKVLPPAERGKLLAQRSLIELDAARTKTKGALPPSEPLLMAARKDAAEAAKAGLAEGHYAVGRVAEETGQVNAAITSYRAAVTAHPVIDAEGSRYRMALARVLLLPQEARPAQQPAGPKVGWRDPAPYPAQHFADMKNLVLMVTLGLQAPLLPGEEPGLEEAEKLADEVLRAPPGTVPFNVLAQALAIKGRWNAALQTYVEGIRPMLPREYGNGLMYLILNHPRLKRPDSLRIPNPMDAEKHFSAGLNFYFDGDYANAEKAFLLTIENDGNDARYFYFLGLSRLAQKRRLDANADFDQGAALERINRPSPATVSESLERIQGPTRLLINDYRQRQELPPERSGK